MEMKKFLQKKLNNEKGMTLIELLAVIVIIAIIAAIAIPAIGNIIENSRIDAAKSDALNAISAASLYEAQEGPIPATGIALSELVTKGFLEDTGTLTNTGKVFPGPSISAVAASIVASNDLTIGATGTPLTKTNLSNTQSTSDVRKALEAGDHTITFTP